MRSNIEMIKKQLRFPILLILCGTLSSCSPEFWLEVLAAALMDTSTSGTSYNSTSGTGTTYTSTYTPTYTGTTSTTSTSSSSSYQKTKHPRKCTSCFIVGSGKCHNCSGRGTYYIMSSDKHVTCPSCNGTGKCRVCNGTGTSGYDYY